MEAGVPHVICCRGRVFDGACKTFTKADEGMKDDESEHGKIWEVSEEHLNE